MLCAQTAYAHTLEVIVYVNCTLAQNVGHEPTFCDVRVRVRCVDVITQYLRYNNRKLR